MVTIDYNSCVTFIIYKCFWIDVFGRKLVSFYEVIIEEKFYVYMLFAILKFIKIFGQNLCIKNY